MADVVAVILRVIFAFIAAVPDAAYHLLKKIYKIFKKAINRGKSQWISI